jgi:hypothetical protein
VIGVENKFLGLVVTLAVSACYADQHDTHAVVLSCSYTLTEVLVASKQHSIADASVLGEGVAAIEATPRRSLTLTSPATSRCSWVRIPSRAASYQ